MGIFDRLNIPNPFKNVIDSVLGPEQQSAAQAQPTPAPDPMAIVQALFPEFDVWEGLREVGPTTNTPEAEAPVAALAPEPTATKPERITRRPLPNQTVQRNSRDMSVYREAIHQIESAGSGSYNAIGATHPKLGRALGKYQVMEANVGPWSQEALGRRITPEEFLANPAFQDTIFDHKFGQFISRYGSPEDAASVWFTGRPRGTRGSDSAQDVHGTTGAGYVAKFSNLVNSPGFGHTEREMARQPALGGSGQLTTQLPAPEGPANRPPPKGPLAAAAELTGPDEERSTLAPAPDPAEAKRAMIIDAVRKTRDIASLRDLPRTEIVSLLQQMGRGVAGLPGISTEV